MSQKGSSMASDNPEFKYKKALLEIQKIHNANKELKRQSEQMKSQYERQINQLNDSYGHLQKECFNLKQQKSDLEKYYEQLTFSHSDQQESINNLKRQVKYLNDALNDQSEQLKKVDALKSQKGLSTLISSYEDRELSYRKDINRLEEMNKNLKANFDSLQADLSQERRQRFKLEDLNNNLKMEIAGYREHNNILINKNEQIVATLLNKSTEGKEKFREAESMLYELSRQLEMVKNTRIEQQTSNRATVSIQNYEVVLNEKAKLENEVSKMRDKMEQFDYKSRAAFEMEQKMKRAQIRAQQLQEECNMLKGRLIVMETKDVMEGDSDFGDLKDLQERLLATAGQNDPLATIKNGSDSSHFQLMKTYIIDLKEKLAKAVVSRREYEKKYRSLKEKLTDKAEKSISFEEQNKLLKGKIEGYERLTDRLQYELQKSIEVHEEEVSKMKTVTNNIIAKKTEEVKVANAYVRAQLDLQLDKFEKTEKGLRQELDTVKLELSTEKIKSNDLQEKYHQASQFLMIYEKKFKDVTSNNQQVEEHNEALMQNAAKYEQLYRQERSKNEVLLSQKNNLTSKVAQLSEDLQRKSNQLDELTTRHNLVEEEAKKVKLELTQARAELDNVQGMFKLSKKEFEDKSRVAMLDISRTETSYYTSLEQNFNQEREKNRQLEAEIQALKLRLQRTVIVSQKVPQLQDQLNSKIDELNDFKRKAILTEKQINVQESEIRQIKNEFDILRRQNNGLKAKMLESGHELRRSYETKDIDTKKAIQKINEELSSALAELREQRRINSRMQTDIQGHRSEVQRLATMLEQSKSKDSQLYEQNSLLKNANQTMSDEAERLKSEIRYKNNTIQSLNNDINSVQERVYKLSQQISEVKIKKQQSQNNLADLKREISSLKVYMTEVESFGNSKVASGNWQQQRERENVSNFVQRVKKIVKKAELVSNTDFTSDFRTSTFNATPSYVPDYLKNYHEPLFSNYANTYKGSEVEAQVTDSPRTETYTSFGTGLPFKYGDYN